MVRSTEDAQLQLGHRIVNFRRRGGKLLFQGTLRPGSPQSITGRPPFRMKLGHAQHVTIRLDDSLVDSGVYVPKRGSVARFTLGREPG